MKKFIVCAFIGVAIFTTGCKKYSFDNPQNQEYSSEKANSNNEKGPHAFPDKTVRVLYVIPKDVSFNSMYFKSILKAAPVLQKWYKDQLDGKTYKLNKPIVEVCKSQKPEAWFRANNGADVSGTDFHYYFWFNTITEVSTLLKKGWDLTKYTFTIYIDADGTGTGGVQGYCLMPRNDLKGLSGQSSEPVSRWIGGWGHELGHAFGLPHPDGSPYWNQAIMGAGYQIFPECFFLESDKSTLFSCGFIF